MVYYRKYGNFLKLVDDFLRNRYRRVAVNVQASSWTDVKAGVPQGSIRSSLFFLIYINDLSENIKSAFKHFPENTSIFYVVKKPNTSSEILSHDFTKIFE